ncbi:MAG: alpha/beta hydrolase [Rhodospirillaceae bacterium]
MKPKRTPLTIGQEVMIAWSRIYTTTAMSLATMLRDDGPSKIETFSYGDHADEQLDVMTPIDGITKTAVLFIHGGGWTMGHKEFYRADLNPICKAGHCVINVEYPKAPDHPHPHILKSIFKALRWCKHHQDIDQLHLIGDSAGGNLAIMSGLFWANPKLQKVFGDDDLKDDQLSRDIPDVISVSSLYGILDRQSCRDEMFAGGEAMLAAYGGQAVLAETVDIDHAITPMDVSFDQHPRCFLAVGSDDVLLQSSRDYHQRLLKAGHDVALKVYKGATHGFLSWPQNGQRDELIRNIVTFLKSAEPG